MPKRFVFKTSRRIFHPASTPESFLIISFFRDKCKLLFRKKKIQSYHFRTVCALHMQTWLNSNPGPGILTAFY